MLGHRRTFCGPEPPESRPAAGAARLVTHVERTLRTDAPFAAAALAAGGAAAPWREAPWVSCFCPRVLYFSSAYHYSSSRLLCCQHVAGTTALLSLIVLAQLCLIGALHT